MKIMKKFALAMAILMLALSFAGCAGKKAGKYIIATDTAFTPFEFEDKDGKFVGIDIDILDAIAKDQGFEYELQALGFNAAAQALEMKQVDGVIAGMSITEKRKLEFDFSSPYFDSGVVMGIAAGNNDVKGYEDIAGKSVAVKTGTKGSAFAESIKDKYGFTITYFEESADLYEEVKAGNSVACFEDYPVLGYAITQNAGLKIVTEKEQGSSYGFAVCKGEDAKLLTMFNKGFANIKANGKYQEILDKYIQK